MLSINLSSVESCHDKSHDKINSIKQHNKQHNYLIVYIQKILTYYWCIMEVLCRLLCIQRFV